MKPTIQRMIYQDTINSTLKLPTSGLATAKQLGVHVLEETKYSIISNRAWFTKVYLLNIYGDENTYELHLNSPQTTSPQQTISNIELERQAFQFKTRVHEAFYAVKQRWPHLVAFRASPSNFTSGWHQMTPAWPLTLAMRNTLVRNSLTKFDELWSQ